ncbi:hypothetical protein KP509_03G086600 [Ceratopteris richardii]|uniref:Uncharacterized protein n=1 Tax=Ceratopteris richardii TaxID=49495 RepID=A0A8T2V8S3_CERRI|nr:hypothetical protein KP509_03G086600 [Ceratopteris richardii]
MILLEPSPCAWEVGPLTVFIKTSKSQLRKMGYITDEKLGKFSFDASAEACPVEATYHDHVVLLKELEELQRWVLGASHPPHCRGKFINTRIISDKWESETSSSVRGDLASTVVHGMGCGGMGFTIARNNASVMRYVESAAVDRSALCLQISSEKARWIPDLSFISKWITGRHRHSHWWRKEKYIELWVVTEVFYHRGIKHTDDTSIQANAKVNIPIAGTSTQAGCGVAMRKTQRTETQMADRSQTARIPFAFKAIRLWYHPKSQELIKATSAMPKHPPSGC